MKSENQYHCIAKTFFGLERVLTNELESFNVENIQERNRAIEFTCTKAQLYQLNLSLRTALRLLVPLDSRIVENDKELYDFAKAIDWQKYFDLKCTFSVDSTVSSDVFTHSKYVALKTKDAIVDYFREKTGNRPSVDRDAPDIRINIHIYEKRATISLDSSGDSLHKRGYRIETNEAPINEVVAASLVLMSNWTKERTFLDPFSGSGTIPIEAAMIAMNKAPNLNRDEFSFFYWKDFDSLLFDNVKHAAKDAERPVTTKIIGRDKVMKNIRMAERNAVQAQVSDIVKFERKDFLKSKGEEGMVVVTNPPYGERLGEDEEMLDFYQEISATLKHNYINCDAFVISAHLEGLKHFGLKSSQKKKLFNGNLDCLFMHYELYEGSKKEEIEQNEI